MPVFLERYLLPVTATLTILVIFTNPMGLDWNQRISGGLALLCSAYFVGHTIHKANEARKLLHSDQPTASQLQPAQMPPSMATVTSAERQRTVEVLNLQLLAVVKERIVTTRDITSQMQILSGELAKLQKVIELVEDGADVNARDENGETSLHWAAYYGHALLIQYLLQHGADPNIKGNAGLTALDWAKESQEAIRILEDHGTDADKATLQYIQRHLNK